jgi:PPOX class probable F420-dependent enzyme
MVRTLAVTTTVLLALPAGDARAQTPTVPDRGAIVAAAQTIATKARFCTLVTVGDEGHPQARIVDPFPPEGEMTIWIATNPVTRKVREVRKDPRVTLVWFDPSGPGYVTLLGTAEVVTDPAETGGRWKDDWAAFYKDKNRGDDYVLLRVSPRRLEVVSYADGIMNDPVTWTPASIEFPERPAPRGQAGR